MRSFTSVSQIFTDHVKIEAAGQWDAVGWAGFFG